MKAFWFQFQEFSSSENEMENSHEKAYNWEMY